MKKNCFLSSILFLLLSAFVGYCPAMAADEPYEGEWEDHEAMYEYDSKLEKAFVTDDLACMEVKGHVKSIELTRGKETFYIDFDKEGNLVSYKDSKGSYQVTREDDTLHMYAIGAGSIVYKLEDGCMRLANAEGGEGDYYYNHQYVYENDELVKIISSEEGSNGQKSKTLAVTVLARDNNHENWTRRKIGDQEESRVIKYHPNIFPDEYENESSSTKEFDPMKYSWNFTGSIGGDASLVINGGEGSYTISYGTRLVKVDSFDKKTGKLVLSAYFQKNNTLCGHFEGTVTTSKDNLITYKGVFINTKGGKVDFKLTTK